jgi:hypothetical protein
MVIIISYGIERRFKMKIFFQRVHVAVEIIVEI